MLGVNAGGQRSILIFEAGFVRRDPERGTEVARSVAFHALEVVPSSISYSYGSRSAVTQTLGGLTVTRGGRAPTVVTLQGVWGVEARGVPPFGGTGPERSERFLQEIVRFGDAVTRKDADGFLRMGTVPSPGMQQITALFDPFDPQRDTPYVNFYDLWHNQRFQAVVNYDPRIGARQGGATGNRAYVIRVSEAGPIVASTLTDGFIEDLLDGLATWQRVNETIRGFDVGNVIDNTLSFPALLVSELTTTVAAVVDSLPSATDLVTTRFVSSAGGSIGVPTYLGQSARMSAAAQQMVEAKESTVARTVTPPLGQVDWSGMAATRTSSVLEDHALLDSLAELADAGRFQAVAGVFFGLSRVEYEALVTGGDTDAGVGGAVTGASIYRVRDLETATTIEQRTGVDFDALLALNRLTPEEALEPGRELLLPTRRRDLPAVIDGLPVFDAHTGQTAWGRDFYADLRAEDGAFAVLSGTDVLVQGVQWLLDTAEPELLGHVGQLAGVGGEDIAAEHLRTLLQSDRRVERVDSITVVQVGAALQVQTRVTAIHGGEVSTVEMG